MAATKRRSPNGQGSIFYVDPTPTRRGYWRGKTYTSSGDIVRATGPSREVVRARLQEKVDAAARPALSPLSVAGWLEEWVRVNLPRLPLKSGTKEAYANCIKAYGIPAAKDLMLADFTPTKAETWLERVKAMPKRNGEPLSASTVKNTYQAAVNALDIAVRDGLIIENPLRKISRPKVTRVAVPVTSAEDFERLLIAVEGRRIAPLVAFVGFTGVRVSEALGLKWQDVDLGKGVATIRESSPGAGSTKTDKWRTLTLVPEVIEALKFVKVRTARERLALGKGWTDSRLVFVAATGQALDSHNMRRELKSAILAANKADVERAKQAGIEAPKPLSVDRVWHSLRHGLAYTLLAKGLPLHVVGKVLGHSSVSMTADIYGHIDSQVPVEVLSNALRR